MISVIIYIVTLMAKKDVQKGKIGRYFLIHNSHFHLHQIAPKGYSMLLKIPFLLGKSVGSNWQFRNESK